MKVLLVTWTDKLKEKLEALNPDLEYCAIVVDKVEPAKEVLESVGLPKELIHPLNTLKNCVELSYDYVLCIDVNWKFDHLKAVQECGVAKNKAVAFNIPSQREFLVERSLRYFKDHATEFEMFATGISYAETGLNVTRFKRKCFNFARSSQDLYYNLQTAKFALSCGGGHSTIRYALIGLAPYSLHNDMSKSINLQFLILWYLIGFNDLHNFFVPIAVYRKFFREEYLNKKIPLEPFDINDPFHVKKYLGKVYRGENSEESTITDSSKVVQSKFDGSTAKEAPVRADGKGGRKNFPATCRENIKILDDYLTLCEENNIRPIMFLAPMPQVYMENYFKPQIEEFRYIVAEACLKHPTACFVDGWKLNFITDNDFYDKGHMNLQGATKFSTYLNDFIETL